MTYTLDTIEDIAHTIHSKINVNNKLVIDVVDISNELGFGVFTSHFNDDVSGMVISSNEEKSIYVNQDDTPQRQRFTISHEIGHIILHHKVGEGDFRQVDYRKMNNSYNHREWEADAFAAALLMPKDKAISVWNLLEDVDDFANSFKVSKLAASIRLHNLGLI